MLNADTKELVSDQLPPGELGVAIKFEYRYDLVSMRTEYHEYYGEVYPLTLSVKYKLESEMEWKRCAGNQHVPFTDDEFSLEWGNSENSPQYFNLVSTPYMSAKDINHDEFFKLREFTDNIMKTRLKHGFVNSAPRYMEDCISELEGLVGISLTSYSLRKIEPIEMYDWNALVPSVLDGYAYELIYALDPIRRTFRQMFRNL